MVEALSSRLKLRDMFLSAAECPQFVAQPDLARRPWEAALTLLPTIKATHNLSKPVDESFSVKLQRKLASTVPPRPIVKLSFENAFGHLDRLFKDGCELINVLSYTNSQCLQVRSPVQNRACAELTSLLRHSCAIFRQRNRSLSSMYGLYSKHSSSTPWKCLEE